MSVLASIKLASNYVLNNSHSSVFLNRKNSSRNRYVYIKVTTNQITSPVSWLDHYCFVFIALFSRVCLLPCVYCSSNKYWICCIEESCSIIYYAFTLFATTAAAAAAYTKDVIFNTNMSNFSSNEILFVLYGCVCVCVMRLGALAQKLNRSALNNTSGSVKWNTIKRFNLRETVRLVVRTEQQFWSNRWHLVPQQRFVCTHKCT